MSTTALISAPPTAAKVCVFWLPSGCYAVDAPLVGEIADAESVAPLPRCHAAVLGLANLRGRALAVVDLERALDIDAPPLRRQVRRLLVLRLPSVAAGAPIERVEGIFTHEPGGFRAANRVAEPDHVAGFISFPERPGLVATLIAAPALARRLDALRFTRARHR